jgi:hypothetical protein
MTSPSSSQSEGYHGQAEATSHGSDLNAMAFVFQMFMGKVRTAMLVKVKAVTNSGGVSPVGTVDVQPMVNQVDGAGKAVAHGTVYEIPYFRLQGGANAVVLDPQVGDIGVAIFADRDISAVKASRATSNPGSFRRFDMADGLYMGGFLNGTPSQYVQFSSAGIKLRSPTAIILDAPDIQINGATAITGGLTNNGVNVGSTHTHGGVQTGSGNTGTPS